METPVDLDAVRELIRLRERKSELNGKLSDVEDRLKKLTPILLDEFAQAGVQRITVDGKTIYHSRRVWVGRADGVDLEEFMDVLREEGLGDLVKASVNSQTISAWYREQEDLGEPIPDRLSEVMKVSEVFDLGVRKAN